MNILNILKTHKYIIESIVGSYQLYVPRPKKVNEMFMKPNHAYNVLWTSTAKQSNGKYTSEWVEWCKSEMPHWLNSAGTLYKVNSNARILQMNTDEDVIDIAGKYGIDPPADRMASFTWSQNFPWDKIKHDYDAVSHVPTDRWNSMLMYGWDVESTVWLNKSVLTEINIVDIDLD